MLLTSACLSALFFSGVLGDKATWKREFLAEDLEHIDHRSLFNDWAADNAREYASAEEKAYRLSVFSKNLVGIGKHNSRKLQWRESLNLFGDWTTQEFMDFVGKSEEPKPDKKRRSLLDEATAFGDRSVKNPPVVDWEKAGMVTPVKYQAHCGSCWSFAATGALECNYAIANNGLLNSLSEQQLVSCEHVSHGCNGGMAVYAYDYVAQKGGLCLETAYPYNSSDGYVGECFEELCGKYYNNLSEYQFVKPLDTWALESAISHGCTSVSIESNPNFHFYSSGVFTAECTANTNHAVLAVGYGTDEFGNDYWKIKNSWSTNWGEDGYVRMCRNCHKNCKVYYPETELCQGQCGILDHPAIPLFD